jgi:hypothetical protein
VAGGIEGSLRKRLRRNIMAPDASGIEPMDIFEQNSIKMIAESFDLGKIAHILEDDV